MRTVPLISCLALALACVEDGVEPPPGTTAGVTTCAPDQPCMTHAESEPGGDGPVNCTDSCADYRWTPACEACDPTVHGEPNCAYDCTVRDDHCFPAFVVRCGDVVFGTTNGAGSTDNVYGYRGTDRELPGRELAFELIPPHGDAHVTIELEGYHGFEPEAFVLERVVGACHGDYALHDLTAQPESFDAWEVEDTVIVVDSAKDDSGWFEMRVSCTGFQTNH